MVPASDAAASRWLLYTAAIPSGFLTKPRYTLPPRVWPWGCHFCSCNCPGIEAAWVSHAERLSHFSEKLQGHVARPEESWGDRQEGVFQEYKMWQLAWYKCACGSLAYLSRNTETWPSLGQHEKNKKTKQNKTKKKKNKNNKNKTKNSSFFTPKRQKTECELAKIFLWKHCMRLLSLDSASLLGK